MRTLLFAAMLAGCAAPYQSGALLAPSAHAHAVARTFGCVDMSVRVAPSSVVARDRGTSPDRVRSCMDYEVRARQLPPSGVVVAVDFANRCTIPVRVDLSALSVRAESPDGESESLTRFDPRLEVRPGVLDPRAQGEELFEFDPVGSAFIAESVCVTVAGTVSGASGEFCFERSGDALVPSNEDAP